MHEDDDEKEEKVRMIHPFALSLSLSHSSSVCLCAQYTRPHSRQEGGRAGGEMRKDFFFNFTLIPWTVVRSLARTLAHSFVSVYTHACVCARSGGMRGCAVEERERGERGFRRKSKMKRKVFFSVEMESGYVWRVAVE